MEYLPVPEGSSGVRGSGVELIEPTCPFTSDTNTRCFLRELGSGRLTNVDWETQTHRPSRKVGVARRPEDALLQDVGSLGHARVVLLSPRAYGHGPPYVRVDARTHAETTLQNTFGDIRGGTTNGGPFLLVAVGVVPDKGVSILVPGTGHQNPKHYPEGYGKTVHWTHDSDVQCIQILYFCF